MAIARERSIEEKIYDNLEDALQNVENDFIIRKAQMQQIRQQNKKNSGNKRGKQSNQNSMNQSPSPTGEN